MILNEYFLNILGNIRDAKFLLFGIALQFLEYSSFLIFGNRSDFMKSF